MKEELIIKINKYKSVPVEFSSNEPNLIHNTRERIMFIILVFISEVEKRRHI